MSRFDLREARNILQVIGEEITTNLLLRQHAKKVLLETTALAGYSLSSHQRRKSKNRSQKAS